jgi:hypothetical protein
MNERIRELAEQAEFSEKDLHIQGDNFQKFAELLVKECIDCAVWVGNNNHNPVEPIHTAHAVKRRIEKQFGVEE